MPNMSYCRFENTYNDLLDCYDELSNSIDLNDINESEREYIPMLIELCRSIEQEFGDMDWSE